MGSDDEEHIEDEEEEQDRGRKGKNVRKRDLSPAKKPRKEVPKKQKPPNKKGEKEERLSKEEEVDEQPPEEDERDEEQPPEEEQPQEEEEDEEGRVSCWKDEQGRPIHRRYQVIKRPVLRRTRSDGEEYSLRMRKPLKAAKNLAAPKLKALIKKKEVLKTGNAVSLSPVISYSIDGGKTTQWTGTVPKVWTSGYAKGEEGKPKQERMDGWLAEMRDKEDVSALGKEGVRVDKDTSNSALSAHSEIDCVSDPELVTLLDATIDDFLKSLKGDKKTLVVADSMVGAHSEPNAMCSGACSLALDKVGQIFHGRVKEKVEGVGGRLSAEHAYGTVVGSARQFGPQLSMEFNQLALNADPKNEGVEVGKGHTLLEQAARSRAGIKKKKSVTGKKTKAPPRQSYKSDDSEDEGAKKKEEGKSKEPDEEQDEEEGVEEEET